MRGIRRRREVLQAVSYGAGLEWRIPRRGVRPGRHAVPDGLRNTLTGGCTTLLSGTIHPIMIARLVDAPIMISPLRSATSGMLDATNRFDRASARIAQPEPTDLHRDRVDQITAKHDLAANVATVRTADEMLGTLIDIVA